MNSVILIGRLTRDPEVRYTAGTQMAIATFDLAVDRPQRQGQEKQTDFPRITVFGKQAEACEKYLRKGRLVCVEGRLQTGSYKNKNGDTVYTTDVVANRVEFLESNKGAAPSGGRSSVRTAVRENKEPTAKKPIADPREDDFEAIQEDIPF